MRGTRSIERQLTQLETTRAIVAALPDRDQLVVGHLSGALAGYRWRVDVSPFTAPDIDLQQAQGGCHSRLSSRRGHRTAQ